MLDAVKRLHVPIIEASATGFTRESDGVTIETTKEPVKARAIIFAAGVRGDTTIARKLGLGVPPTVHGIFGDFQYDGEWTSPELGFLFNLDLVTGYFWCAYARKAKRVSIGIMNEKCLAPKELIRRFANTGIIPEIKDKLPADLDIQEGHLGVVPHLKESTWPVARIAPGVISVGEATGQIGAYIYEGLFARRYEGKAAAKVLADIKKDGAWGDASRLKRYEAEVKVLDDYSSGWGGCSTMRCTTGHKRANRAGGLPQGVQRARQGRVRCDESAVPGVLEHGQVRAEPVRGHHRARAVLRQDPGHGLARRGPDAEMRHQRQPQSGISYLSLLGALGFARSSVLIS